MRPRSPLYRALAALLRRWLRPTVLDPEATLRCREPRCYALAQRSALDLVALEIACARNGLPSPREPLATEGLEGLGGYVWLGHLEGGRRRKPRTAPALPALIHAARAGCRVSIVPVSVFWGRAPARERSLLRLLLSERWTVTGRLRRLLVLVFTRHDVFVQLGTPVPMSDVVGPDEPADRSRRRIARLLRTQLRRQRAALIGPDLSHRRTIVRRVLRTPAVRSTIAALATARRTRQSRLARRARREALKIAADLSYPVVRGFDLLLTWVWHRLYDGIDVHGIDAVKPVAETHVIVYVPCHRSHMDYLLLSYVLYYNGLMLPHIAAGENLDLPLVGPLLRRAGAFFIRRSFRGDRLYTTVLAEYLHCVFSDGFSVEYFIEGSRSRTGRLLPARPGMLAMTLRSVLREPERKLAFVPVYFGYERVLEAQAYLGELRGDPKRKESLLSLARSVRALREYCGRVQVTFGRPIPCDAFLDEQAVPWRQGLPAETPRPPWFDRTVEALGERILCGINAAAAVNPVHAVALALLSAPRCALDVRTLEGQLDSLLAIARATSVAADATVTSLTASEVIAHAERLGVVERESLPLGDVLALNGNNAVLMTWYRNNVLHLFALPSLVATLFMPGQPISRETAIGHCHVVYPYLARELYLALPREALAEAVDEQLELLVSRGLLQREAQGFVAAPRATAAFNQLAALARILQQTFERYFIVIALLQAQPPGTLKRPDLETRCRLMAQRVARLYGLNAPEFFDATLFSRFVQTLLREGMVAEDDTGCLHYDSRLARIAEDAAAFIDPDLRSDVMQARRLPELTNERADP